MSQIKPSEVSEILKQQIDGFKSGVELEEVGTELRSDQMVEETKRDMQTLLSLMVDVTDAAINMGDVGTEHMMNAMIHKTEKTHWMLTAWSKSDQLVLS